MVAARKAAVAVRDGSDFNHSIIAIVPVVMPIGLIRTSNIVKAPRLMPSMMMPRCSDEFDGDACSARQETRAVVAKQKTRGSPAR
jgi:hypothetical protein